MRAIDLYSGVGGWSLGLRLAGVEVAASYERFEPANNTNTQNNGHLAVSADIRTMDLNILPTDIDLIVGSPPCTQFSYSNKGGGGDIFDGLKDIARFLEIVELLKPRFWAMENVPRVADILRKELREGGILEKYNHLGAVIKVVNMESWGLPQRRKRCIAGNIDFDLLDSYSELSRPLTLGDVVNSLRGEVLVDPIYGIDLHRTCVTDHITEDSLNAEEVRVNRSAKECHPVYNAMSFPDPLDRSVRTITATCTRVSRESVVIADPDRAGEYRRLTLRERACLQGFPISFQFYGTSHGQKGTMIGNAVPPLFSFYVAQCCLQREVDQIILPSDAISRFRPSGGPAAVTKVETAGRRYPEERTFRFSVPGLNFKSGVRFELTNRKDGIAPRWNVAFYFGHSTSIQNLKLNADAHNVLMSALPNEIRKRLEPDLIALREYVISSDVKRMQDVWTRRHPGGTRPFDFLDELARSGAVFAATLAGLCPFAATEAVNLVVQAQFGEAGLTMTGVQKLRRNSHSILAGLLMGAAVNECIDPTNQPVPEREKRLATG